jgi:hypothetical protein
MDSKTLALALHRGEPSSIACNFDKDSRCMEVAMEQYFPRVFPLSLPTVVPSLPHGMCDSTDRPTGTSHPRLGTKLRASSLTRQLADVGIKSLVSDDSVTYIFLRIHSSQSLNFSLDKSSKNQESIIYTVLSGKFSFGYFTTLFQEYSL